MNSWRSPAVSRLGTIAKEVTQRHIAPLSETVDKDASWPASSLQALAEAGLTGLHVPKHLGGHGEGLQALVHTCAIVAKGCASTAMCFAMHNVATAVIAAKATTDQQERYLKAIAKGKHISALALSESGTGVHFYLPRTVLRRQGDSFLVDGVKQFVTSGGHADSYVISTETSHNGQGSGEFSCLIVDGDTPGLAWKSPWRGFGLRGNSSVGLTLADVRVPMSNLLGQEGDQVWYVFEIIAPYFLMGMAAVYLGLAEAAFGEALEYIRRREYAHTGHLLMDFPVIQHKLAELWARLEKCKRFVYMTARSADLGHDDGQRLVMMAKVDASETAVQISNEAMTLCGGSAYRDNGRLSRILRDARASHVMSPTTDLLKQWTGRSLLGLPIL